MKSYKNLPLKRQFYLLFGMTALIVFGSALLFYQVSFRSLLDKESRYMENMLSQVAQRTEDITNSVKLVAKTVSGSPATIHLLTETNSTQKWAYRQTLNNLITELSNSNPSIQMILLLDTKGKVYSFNGYDYSLASRLDAQYQFFSSGTYAGGFTGAMTLPDSSSVYYACTQPVYLQGKPATEENKLGTCLILCSSDALYDACSSTASSEHSFFAVLDAGQGILSENRVDSRFDADILPAILSEARQDTSSKIDGISYLVNQIPSLSVTGWSVVSIVPYSDISADLSRFHAIALLFMAILLFTFLVLIRQIMKSITLPTLKIVDFVRENPYDILHGHLDIKGPPEIRQLASGINQMLDQINDLTHTVLQNQSRMYEIELGNHQARLSALQSQINPHFLYNTLDAIRGLTYLGKQEEIRTILSALSHIMRYNIKGEEMVSVEEELLCVQKYIQIIDMRFSGRFQINLNIQEEIRNYKMPRFLLQPLAENAIFHGLELRPGKGTLTLVCSLGQDGILHFTCTDDGVGIPAEKLEQLQEALANDSFLSRKAEGNAHIGLQNIHLRIRLLYGPPYGLSIASTQGLGTTVRLDFPAAPDNLPKPQTQLGPF